MKTLGRIIVLLVCLLIAVSAFAAWSLPAPYGLFAAGLGIVIVFSVVRRWSWVERDREAFLAARDSVPSIERIGFAEDLRDEALTAIAYPFKQIRLARDGAF